MMIKPYIGPAYNNSVMKITQALLDDLTAQACKIACMLE